MEEYRLFLDESGDHNMQNVDQNFPVFCLTGVIFEKNYYHDHARSEFDKLKMEFWGKTDIIFHSREIRKQEGEFSILSNNEIRSKFFERLNQLISDLRFSILAVVILKNSHKLKYGERAHHPYNLALEFIMERYFMRMNNQWTYDCGFITAESRGDQEDKILKSEYNRIKDHGNLYFKKGMPNITNLWMEKKSSNLVGLQLADLIAYPLASKVLRPENENLSFNVFANKICSDPRAKGNRIIGYGLKIFPHPSKEHLLLWG